MTARYVEMTIDDNWRGFQSGIGGGDRVSLGEVAFENRVVDPRPVIEVASGVDLGDYESYPGQVSIPLQIGNIGAELPLEVSVGTLRNGTPGAGYFSSSGTPLNIATGESAALTLTFDSGGAEGCFYTILELTTNAPALPLVEITLLASINCTPEVPEEPAFSIDSGTFTDSFLLELTTATPGGRIVFTTDGSLPSATNGTTYTGAITIGSSTQLRAAAVSGEHPPAVATENYLFLAPDVAAYTSALPILIVENYAAGTIPNKGWLTNTQTGAGLQQLPQQHAYIQIVDRDPDTNTASISTTPDLTSRIGIRVRGAFSSTWNQKPYSLETWKKDADTDRKVKPLGLPEESDWILYYLHPSYDRTMLYNTFIWELSAQTGRYGTRFRFVDVFVNEDGGDLTVSDRRGVYALAEKVKRGGDRIDFDALSDDGSSGGWLLGINRMDAIPVGGFPADNGATTPQFFHTAGSNRIQQTAPNAAGQGEDIPRQYNAYINFEDPNGYRINAAQQAVIEDWFHEFEDIFYNDDLWLDPASWRASATVGGHPGGSDATSFAGDPTADLDSDGMAAPLEYAFGSSDTSPAGSPLKITTTGGVLLATVTSKAGADDVGLSLESSDDLSSWTTVPAEAFTRINSSGEGATRLVRFTGSPGYFDTAKQIFLRVRVDLEN